jgi:hypothetical protein
MAVETFEGIYGRLSADEKKLLDSVFAKEPELKKGWLRQDDYSRQSNELKTRETRLGELERYESEMGPWAEEAHKRIRTMETAGIIDANGNDLWTDQKADYEKRLAAAIAGGEMDPAELERRVRDIVKASGAAFTKDELKVIVDAEVKSMVGETFDAKYKEKENHFNTNVIPFTAGFGAGVALTAVHYEKETGQPWTADKSKELFDRMSKEQNFDPYVVGEKMLEPFKEKRAQEAEIEKRVQERLSQMGMPGGGAEGYIPQGMQPPPKGALQQALERTQPNGTLDIDTIIAQQGVKAAEALRTEGKF